MQPAIMVAARAIGAIAFIVASLVSRNAIASRFEPNPLDE
jgi:hypothetical protein